MCYIWDTRQLRVLVFPKVFFKTQEKIACSCFIDTLNGPELVYKIWTKAPKNLEEVLCWNIKSNIYRATAMLSAVYAVVVCLSVCLSVCVCVAVTLRYCIKMAKRRITQIMPHDSPLSLVFRCQSSLRNLNGITPYRGDKCRWGGLKFVTFDEKRAITRKWYKIQA